ncbi:hypothetical protein PLESTB_000983300 [Pleodorina starrii]|uniref:Uncharacterized protein n=1 Tax=Pleodorina starrii TaxID=330485 RepID=A0A9W6BNL0_9CHLO|nr:hypothetical protein PLESTB_000983300 [Pleodorina starrii]
MFSEHSSKPYVKDITPRVARVAGGGPGLDEPPKARDRRGVRGQRCVRGRVVRLWRRSHCCRNAPEEEDEEAEAKEAKEAAGRLRTAPRAAAAAEEEQDDAVQLRQCRVAMESAVKAAQHAGRCYFTPARVPRAERGADVGLHGGHTALRDDGLQTLVKKQQRLVKIHVDFMQD